jgi:hypothetical protein
MQHPEAILAAAKSGRIPATWRVLRPKGSYPVGAGCLGAFVMFFLLFAGTIVAFIVLVAGAGTRFGSPSPSGVNANDPGAFFTSFLPVPSPWLIVGGVGLIIVVGLLSAMRAISRIPYSYFVFTPEGAVQAIGPRKVTAIDYSAIDLINTRVQVNTMTYRDAQTGAVTGSSRSVSVWGELHYRNGRTVRFKPAGRFGSPASIIQRLINGHQEYQAMVGAYRPARAAD